MLRFWIVSPMKTLPKLVTCCLLLVSIGFLAGCATPRQADTPAKTAEDKQWEDMTTAQKIGYYMSWPVQWGLLYGGSALASH